jgi:hypothetical protein
MQSLKALLCDDGLMLIRVTNRYGIVWLLRHVFRKTHLPYQVLGDATVTYTKKTIDRLLANNGFTVVERRYWEGGKRERWKFMLFSFVTVPLRWITGGLVVLTPGLTVPAKKARPVSASVS